MGYKSVADIIGLSSFV